MHDSKLLSLFVYYALEAMNLFMAVGAYLHIFCRLLYINFEIGEGVILAPQFSSSNKFIRIQGFVLFYIPFLQLLGPHVQFSFSVWYYYTTHAMLIIVDIMGTFCLGYSETDWIHAHCIQRLFL